MDLPQRFRFERSINPPSIPSSRDQAADSLDRPYSPAARPTETSQKRRRSPQITVGPLLDELARISGLCDLAPRSRGSSSLEETHLPDAGVTDGELGGCHRRERENQGARAKPLVKFSPSSSPKVWHPSAPICVCGLSLRFQLPQLDFQLPLTNCVRQCRLQIHFATSSAPTSPGSTSTPEPAFDSVVERPGRRFA